MPTTTNRRLPTCQNRQKRGVGIPEPSPAADDPQATTAGPAADALTAEALAKRRAFIRALARQAARELAAQALAARDE